MNIQETIERALASAGLDTQSGPMRGVTDTIRNALASAGLAVGAAATPAQAAPPNDNTIDVVAREVPAPGAEAAEADAAGGQFVLRSFSAPAGTRAYKLYVPAQAVGSQKPKAGSLALVVMLHGCTQSADDFAAGTQMNRLADEHGFVVVYPEQASGANASRCWNWFRAEDQVREGGEPALIAGIVQAVAAGHAVDPRRIFVAGLSALLLAGASTAAIAQTVREARPVVIGGSVEIELPGASRNVMGEHRRISLTRIHLEEDVAKSTHLAPRYV